MTAARLRPGLLGSALVLLLVTATRWPVAPKYLYYFDSVNFALALDEFSPALHQPQPPGYPLFVGLTRLIRLVIRSPEDVFLVTGILASTAAVLLLWALGRRMFGPASGLLAAALLIVNPAFWMGGITNQVRIFLALGATAAALPAWRAVEPGQARRPLIALFAALGIAAGFRPVETLLLIPLVLWTWRRTRRPWSDLFIGVAILGATLAAWMLATHAATRGQVNLAEIFWVYAQEQFRGSSAVFGAGAAAAADMFWKAIVWNGTGVLAWIWAAPFHRAWRIDPRLRLHLEFLAVWFLPAFLFSAFIHIGDPDQALAAIPALCLAGGAVLARFVQARSVQPLARVALAVLALNAALFFLPPGRLARAASFRAVRNIDREVTAALESIASLRNRTPLAIIHYGAITSWRQLEYYFPGDFVFVVSQNPADATAREEPWLFHNRRRRPLERAGSAILLPDRCRIVCLLPPGQKSSAVLSPGGGWTEHGPVVYSDSISGGILTVGGQRFLGPR